jgi:hypothetical protein
MVYPVQEAFQYYIQKLLNLLEPKRKKNATNATPSGLLSASATYDGAHLQDVWNFQERMSTLIYAGQKIQNSHLKGIGS